MWHAALRPDRRSLRWKLPWFFAITAAMTVAAFGVVAFLAVRTLAIDTATARLQSALSQISTVIELGVVNQLSALRSAAAEAEVVNALRQPARPVSESAILVLRQLKGVSDSLVIVELVGVDGRVLHTLPGSAIRYPSLSSERALPYPVIGPLTQVDSLVLFQSVTAVTYGGRVIGEIRVTRPHRNSTNRRMASQFIEGAEVLVGNKDGSLWTDGEAVHREPPRDDPWERYQRDGETWLSVSSPIRGTPWMYAVQVPERVAIAPAQRLVLPFVLGAVFIALVGAIVGARVSGRITTPLGALTSATEAIARGDSNVTLEGASRPDEIGRLARAFASMAESVATARSRLEAEVQARTGELVTVSSRLQLLHEELRESEKFATLGRLSGSVGHELRNPLGVMNNVVFLIDALPDASDKLKEYAGLLREQLRVSDRIISDLLDRARSGASVRAPVDVRRLLDEILAHAEVPPAIRIERLESPALPDLMLDRDHVTQILWNLVNNAVQAMHNGPGVLTVSTAWGDGQLSIEVRDTGTGLPEADHERIFEPMYTTKEHGVGLGLAISRAFARADGGALYVRGTTRGACFVLNLPAPMAGASPDDVTGSATGSDPAGKPGRIRPDLPSSSTQAR